MKTLVVYDSVHGNTEKIAQAIGAAIGSDVRVARVGEVNIAELGAFDLVVLGAPTYGGRPTPAMREFLARVPASALQDKKIASFDTRIPAKWVKIFGFAAGKIAGSLKKAGATVLGSEGFFVKDTEGPLLDGELERAATVAQQWVNWVKWAK
jgi:flavodoxin